MDKQLFFESVLKQLGITPNIYNVGFLLTWAKYEGRVKNAIHGFNPLNTTFKLAADKNRTNYNKNGGYPVQNYSTFEHGVSATAKTLQLPYYKNLRQLLKTISTATIPKNELVANEIIKSWGTVEFGKKLKPASGKTDVSHIATIIFIFIVSALIINYT